MAFTETYSGDTPKGNRQRPPLAGARERGIGAYGSAMQPEGAAAKTPRSPSRLTERIAALGIPEKELTRSVLLALSSLLEKLDDVSGDLKRTQDQLSEIERLVDVDCIAPIPNRRAFMRRLSWAIAMQERYGHPSSILYFDVNSFKSINDSYGHAAGDLAIRHVSQILLDAMRESDFLARIGGDEFAIIMYYANAENAQLRGERIAEKIRQSPFVWNGRPVYLSSALGFYALRPGDTADSALAAADTAMYLDKKRHREALTDVKA